MSTLPNKELFRVEEVAEYFGVSQRTVRTWISRGKIKAEKIIGTVRISRQSIMDCRVDIQKVFDNKFKKLRI